MAKHYRLRTHTRFGAQGETKTDAELKTAGADDNTIQDLVDRRALEEVSAPKARTDRPGVPSDEQNKLNVENAIRDETVARNEPLSPAERDELAAQVTKDSGRPLRTGDAKTSGRDIDKSEAQQEKARAADEKAQQQQAQRDAAKGNR